MVLLSRYIVKTEQLVDIRCSGTSEDAPKIFRIFRSNIVSYISSKRIIQITGKPLLYLITPQRRNFLKQKNILGRKTNSKMHEYEKYHEM